MIMIFSLKIYMKYLARDLEFNTFSLQQSLLILISFDICNSQDLLDLCTLTIYAEKNMSIYLIHLYTFVIFGGVFN